MKRGVDFPLHSDSYECDGWNETEKQKRVGIFGSTHCAQVIESVLGRRSTLQKWLTAFPQKFPFLNTCSRPGSLVGFKQPLVCVCFTWETASRTALHCISLSVCVPKLSPFTSCENRKWQNRKALYACALATGLSLQSWKQGYVGCDL